MRSGRLPVGGPPAFVETSRVGQLDSGALTSVPGVTRLFSASV